MVYIAVVINFIGWFMWPNRFWYGLDCRDIGMCECIFYFSRELGSRGGGISPRIR